MAQLTSPGLRAVAHDLRRDWGGWSRGERLTATLVGAAILTLALVLLAPRALPW